MSSDSLASSAEVPAPDPAYKTKRRRRGRNGSSERRRMALMTGFGSADGRNAEEDVDPSAGLVNLADCMLVFACGLMLALVAYWNIDLEPTVKELDPQQDMSEVSNLDDMEEFLQNNSAGYSEVGRVFKDPETGKLYMLTEDVSIAGTDGSTAEAVDESE